MVVRSPNFKACLIQISDTGRIAFTHAELNMEHINNLSRAMSQNVSITM